MVATLGLLQIVTQVTCGKIILQTTCRFWWTAEVRSIKFLALPPLKEDEKNEELEHFWRVFRERVAIADFEEIKKTFIELFQYAAKIHQTNPTLLDIVLRKLVGCIESKEKSRQVLCIILQNSLNISYNFHHEVDGMTFEKFLRTAVEEIILKKKSLKVSDCNLVTAVAKLNPSIVEEPSQKLLERILSETKVVEGDKIASDNLFQELWTASVRLRRHQKFISKLLVTVNSHADDETSSPIQLEGVQLSDGFTSVVREDFKHRTTTSQLLAIFNTLNYHLKIDCIDNFETSSNPVRVCASVEIVSFFLSALLEHCTFLDSSLPQEWKTKFFTAIADLRNLLFSFSKLLCHDDSSFEKRLFVALYSMVKIWSESYDLLLFYEKDTVTSPLEFPMTDSHLKKIGKQIKKLYDSECERLLKRILLIKTVIHNKEEPQSLNEEIIHQLWKVILQEHFQIIDSLSQNQMSTIASSVVREACNLIERNSGWLSFFKENDFKVSRLLCTSLAFETMQNVIVCCNLSCSRAIFHQMKERGFTTSWLDEDLKESIKAVEEELEIKQHGLNCIAAATIIEEHLKFLSCLPLSCLDSNSRLLLFSLLFFIERETQLHHDIEKYSSLVYLDLLRPNDINILEWFTIPYSFIEHFEYNVTVLSKICKLSMNSLHMLQFWEEFIGQEACNENVTPILLSCFDFSKSKTLSNDQKAYKLKLFSKLSKKFVKNLKEELDDPHQIAALRICLKLTLTNGKKIKDKLKNCVEKTLCLITQKAGTTNNDEFTLEALKLSCVVLQNRGNFELNNDIVKKLCTLSINNPDSKLLNYFFDTLKDKEFDFFATNFSKHTVNTLITGDQEILEKVVLIWESLAKAEMKGVRLKALSSSINYIFDNLLSLEISKSSSVFVLRIFRAFVKSKRTVAPSEKIIDSIFVISSECLNELNADYKLMTCQEAIGLCIDFLRSKTDLVLDRLHVLTDIFRKVFLIILEEGKNTSLSDEQELRILAVEIEKFSTFFAKLKKHVGRISPYLIADMIDASTRAGASIESSICHLLANCDRYAISFLSRTLPTSTQQVFKTTYDNYKKYSKFTGKI
ncbi:hypothetical protein QAD02_018803 [Eretmocerus hayati]|uniref:Uncharacterized protein n=1 Tax=Eretmocerus hayati TaxID=131215 RepID=A0ACC2PJ08_9HYME|nr:hypothetical protein QAD02_018803 [Eretmocerus hayati]